MSLLHIGKLPNKWVGRLKEIISQRLIYFEILKTYIKRNALLTLYISCSFKDSLIIYHV